MARYIPRLNLSRIICVAISEYESLDFQANGIS